MTTVVPPSGSPLSPAGQGLAIQRASHRGIASLSWTDPITLQATVFRFRTNPNEISWSYVLNTKVENTYGGRVVQILSTKIDDLTVKVDCGMGGWNYAVEVATFMRNLLVNQRNGIPATFEYTTRGWKMKVFALAVPFTDSVSATVRELELNFKVQEDVSGVASQTSLTAELAALGDGVGFSHNQYNDAAAGQVSVAPTGPLTVGLPTPGLPSGAYTPGSNVSSVPGGTPGLGSFAGLAGILGFGL